METVSMFNKTVKSLLVDLKQWLPDDNGVRWLRKSYMSKKQEDEQRPMDLFTSFVAENSVREAIEAKDVAHFGDSSLKAMKTGWDNLTDDQRNKTWDYINTLLALSDATGQLSEDSVSTIETIAKQCAKDQEFTKDFDLSNMIEKTSHLMPKLFEQLGMNVSEDEIKDAAKQIQKTNMMGIFSTMMSSSTQSDPI